MTVARMKGKAPVGVTRLKGKTRRQPHASDPIKRAVLDVIDQESGKHQAVAAAPAKAAEPAKVAEAKPPLRINRDLLARARRMGRNRTQSAEQPQVNLFKPYAPAPGVLPAGEKVAMAMDSGLQTWAQDSFNSASAIANPFGSSFAEGIGFLGYSYLAELTQRPEFRRISERIATEMTRKWIRLTIAGEAAEEDEENELGNDRAPTKKKKDKAPDAPLEDEERPDDEIDPLDDDEEEEETPEEKEARERNEALKAKLKKIDTEMKRLDVRGGFRAVGEFDGWMGRSHLYLDTGDGDNAEELLTNLGSGSDEATLSKFKKGSLRAIKHVEPIWCYPVSYNATDPLADDWYNPQVWFVMAKRVHVSRLLTFVGRPVPDILKPSYAFGGLSMSQMAKPYVDNWLRTRQAVTNLIESFSISGVYTNAQSILQGEGDDVLDRIELFNATRSNAGTMVLDKEQEEFFNVSTPLGTLDALQAQSQEQMSSVSGIPLVVLLGITPVGLNASSEGEIRVFYDMIHAMQERLFRSKLTVVLAFVQMNLFGEVDPAIGFEFEPLWSLDEKGQADVKKIEMETHVGYVDAGIVGQDEVRGIIVDDEDSPYNGLAADDLPDPPVDDGMVKGPGGGGGGMGGESSDDDAGGAADEMIELADDVYAFAFDEFNESKVKRDAGGKFSSTGGGGGASPGKVTAATSLPSGFKSKKDYIGHLLSKGTTPKEVMQAMGWPSVSMPNQAKTLGLKLEKYNENGVVKYKGVPMTDAEKAAVKEKAKKNPEVTAEVVSEVMKQNPELAAIIKAAEAHNAKQAEKKPAEPTKKEAAAAEVKKPPAPKLTPEQLKKAAKNTPVPLSSSNPDAVAAIKSFNEQYAGKTGLSDEQLAQKVADYKDLQGSIQKAEADTAKANAAAAKEKQEKAAKEKADIDAKIAENVAKQKAELEAQFAADPELKSHYDAMASLFGGDTVAKSYIDQANNKVKKAGLSKIMSGADAAPIIAYSGSHYADVNQQLRKGTMTVPQYKFMKSLNAGLDKLPAHKETTYRKASLSPEQFAAYVPGHVVEERGFTSTSKNQGTWSGSYDFTVHGKSGRDIQKLSSHPGEAEVLFKSGTRFHVVSVKGSHITLEEV